MQTANLFSKELGGEMMFSWGGEVGSQTAGFEDFFGHQMKSSSKENSDSEKYLAAPIRDEGETEHGILRKRNPAKFTIYPGEDQNSEISEKFRFHNSSSIPIAVVQHPKHLELGFSQPTICSGFPYGENYYGVVSTYGPQLTGRVMLNSATDEGAIFVNAKQYKGIIRRRMYRAKAELKNKALKKSKPYLHLSRHLHAMRRPRGCGGRFLNRKELSGSKNGCDEKDTGGGLISWPTESQASEVFQSDGRNSHSPSSRSNYSVSEVSSSFSREDRDPFLMNHLHSSVFSMRNMMNVGHGMDLASKWAAAAADACCNLEV